MELALLPLEVPRVSAGALPKSEEMLPRDDTAWTATSLAPLHSLFLPLTHPHALSFPPSLLLCIEPDFEFQSMGLSMAEPLIMVISW